MFLGASGADASLTALPETPGELGRSGVTPAAIALTRYSSVRPSVPVASTMPAAGALGSSVRQGPPETRRCTAYPATPVDGEAGQVTLTAPPASAVATTAPGGSGAWAPVSGTENVFETPFTEMSTLPASRPAWSGSVVTVTWSILWTPRRVWVVPELWNAAVTPGAPTTSSEMLIGVTAVF